MSANEPSLLELFLSEMETHTGALEQGLLQLEISPKDETLYASLMRAAHSLKGGARVVELDHIVNLAHAMEESFTRAQEGRISLPAERIDILFKSLDVMRGLAEDLEQGNGPEPDEAAGRVAPLIQEMQAWTGIECSEAAPQPVPEPPALSGPAGGEEEGRAQTEGGAGQGHPSDDQPATCPGPDEAADRAVRISAEKIEQLLSLGGEVSVRSRWFAQFSQELTALRKEQRRLLGLIDQLDDRLRVLEEGDVYRDMLLPVKEKTKQCHTLLIERCTEFEQFSGFSMHLSDRIYDEILAIKMRPFAEGVSGFRRMVRDLARETGKKVDFQILGMTTEVDRDILDKLESPLTHLLRNAVDHGIEPPEERGQAGKTETGTLSLEAFHRSGMLMVSVQDDGRGVDLEHLRSSIRSKGLADPALVDRMGEQELMRFLFLPGFSTRSEVSTISGRGVGLDVVDHMIQEVGGTIRASSRPGRGMCIEMELPLTLSVLRMFMVRVAGEPYAFPLARIDRCLMLDREEIQTLENCAFFRLDSTNVALVNVRDILDLPEEGDLRQRLPVVVLGAHSDLYGLVVDGFLGEEDLTVRPLDARLGPVPDISCVAVTLHGEPVLVFDVDEVLHSISKLVHTRSLGPEGAGPDTDAREPGAKRILVVEDSITVREMERKLLQNNGYQVEVAVDGQAGWNLVRNQTFDLVVSDVDMPRMNGIELVKSIRSSSELHELPVIIVSYKDSEEHRYQGMEAGADSYLTKSNFQDESFLQTVEELLG